MLLENKKDLTDKLRRIGNKEVVIMEDYDGSCHHHGTFDSLVGFEDDGGIRVIGDYETARFIKGTIIPTVDSVETWISEKTVTLRKFGQLLGRTEFTRQRDPEANWYFQPETKKWAQEGVIQMFKTPSYDWLRQMIRSLGNKQLHLPEKGTPTNSPSSVPSPQPQPQKPSKGPQAYAIDIETEPIKDSPLKPLEIKTLQLDSKFLKWHEEVKKRMKQIEKE